jgi:hypothetical protein
MSGCLVGLIISVLSVVFLTIFRLLGFALTLMVTSVASLVIGVDEATERIAQSWIEQSTGNGIMIGYNPTAREGLKAAAGGLLFLGWLLDIGAIYLIVSIIANG